MKQRQNIEMVRGDNESVVIPIRDVDADSWITDLSEYDMTYRIARDFGEEPALVFSGSDADVETSVVGNIESAELTRAGVPDTAQAFIIQLKPSDTDSLERRDFVHECEIVDSDGRTKTVMRGKITMEGSISNSA